MGNFEELLLLHELLSNSYWYDYGICIGALTHVNRAVRI